MDEKLIYYIDIDETICNTPTIDGVRSYPDATPILENIKKGNALFTAGHTVVYWTARGATTGINWLELTRSQLEQWGVLFDDVKVGKPNYDVFICDKAMNTEDWE